MESFSGGQLKTLAGFYSNIALTLLTGGAIGPFFTKNVDSHDKLFYTIFALVFGYVFLKLALDISKYFD